MQVLNKRHGDAQGVYIGRPSKFGNPFTHMGTGTLAQFKVATRQEAVARFEAYIRARPALMQAAKNELKGKDLVCWCAPLECHGDVLMRIANEE
jgi:hypothetical protein